MIALTAEAMEANRTESFAAGVDAFVTKPISMDELTREMARCVDLHRLNRAIESSPEAVG